MLAFKEKLIKKLKINQKLLKLMKCCFAYQGKTYKKTLKLTYIEMSEILLGLTLIICTKAKP